MRVVLLLAIAICSPTSLAAVTTFGSTNASRCYEESNMPLSDYGLRYCNAAIKDDQLLLKDLAATYTNRGIIYGATGRLEEAMADHNQAMLIAPDMAKIYVNRGNIFHQMHEYDKALEDYEKALELGNVALDIVHYNRALAFIRLKRWDDAREALEQALEINPNSTRVKRKLEQFAAPEEQPTPQVVAPEENG